MAKNTNLSLAKAAKNDDFYTQECDVMCECVHYTKHFKDKVIYLPFDDVAYSAFFRFFLNNFEFLGLKALICTGMTQPGCPALGVKFTKPLPEGIDAQMVMDYFRKEYRNGEEQRATIAAYTDEELQEMGVNNGKEKGSKG